MEVILPTLAVFSDQEKALVRLYLASQVAEMMGRKLEEDDWAKAYRCARGIPHSGWSNLNIDIMHGTLGVEHKMMRFNDSRPILDACGTTLMHPAGTRAIRIPPEQDATLAARHVLRQYGELIGERTAIVRIVHAYNHGILSREQAVSQLARDVRMKAQAANKALPATLIPVGAADDALDMRFGWLLWQTDLREFLYFEEPMLAPDPEQFEAEWKPSGGGRRKASRNLWVYHKASGEKRYSITTDAGAKIQPYFHVPVPTDPNIYHWVVQGEPVGATQIRVWLSRQTAELLRMGIGSMDCNAISETIRSTDFSVLADTKVQDGFGTTAVEVLVEAEAYQVLCSSVRAVGDEHRFRLLAQVIRGAP